MNAHNRIVLFSLIAFSSLGAGLALGGCGDDGVASGDAGVDASDSAVGPGDAATDAPPADGGGDDGGVGCAVEALCADDDIIVDATWLGAHLDDVDVQVIDVRDPGAHRASRIPGALLVDLDDLRTTVAGVSGQVVSEGAAQDVFRAAGLRDDAALVVYDDQVSTTGARLVWTLEYFGHQRVALLDGGFTAWDDGARPTESGDAAITATEYTIAGVVTERRVDADFIAARLDPPSLGLVDARTDGEYASGHIPGALSVDWTRNVSGGEFRSVDEVRALYTTLDDTATTVAYCQTGSRAAVAYVVLRSLGFADVRLYDGSWAEWGSRPDLPTAP